jgi:hypothetical protein|nr:MAG TPA: holin [Herelleviridae sp.]
MKRLLFLFAMLLTPFALMAQEVIPSEGAITIDLTTFTGIMAFVTMSATQLAKVVPYIDTHKWAKILSAVAIGMLTCILAWFLQVSPLLVGSEWWEALLYGVAVGLSAAGFYDLVKAIGSLFVKRI